jgi:hypothetical protein
MDLSVYANKYSLYWYKYEKGAKDQYEFLGDNWKYLENAINGIPKTGGTSGSFNPVFCAELDKFIEQMMPHDTKEQIYKAVLFYNHQMFISNALTFKNRDNVPDVSILDKADGLNIEHIKDSFNDYWVYDGAGFLYNGADEIMNRQLRCHFNGVVATDNDILPGSTVYWYIPEASLITYNSSDLSNKGFLSDLEMISEDPPSYHKDGYVCFYREIEFDKEIVSDEDAYKSKEKDIDTRDFWYRIKNFYDPAAIKNHILCKIVTSQGEIYETKLYFNFGTKGNNGTRYTITVINKDEYGALKGSESQLRYEVGLRDASN